MSKFRGSYNNLQIKLLKQLNRNGNRYNAKDVCNCDVDGTQNSLQSEWFVWINGWFLLEFF